MALKKNWSEDGSTSISPAGVQQPADTENISALDQSSIGKGSEVSEDMQVDDCSVGSRSMGQRELAAGERAMELLDEMNGAKMSKGKKRALETVSVPQEEHLQTVVSSADGAKIIQNLEKTDARCKKTYPEGATEMWESSTERRWRSRNKNPTLARSG